MVVACPTSKIGELELPNHPALAANRVAVVTGAASGIGLAASAKFAALGHESVHGGLGRRRARGRRREGPRDRGAAGFVRSFAVDVSSLDDVRRLKTSVYDAFGEVAVLMNNAGTGGGGDCSAIPPAGGASSTSTCGA